MNRDERIAEVMRTLKFCRCKELKPSENWPHSKYGKTGDARYTSQGETHLKECPVSVMPVDRYRDIIRPVVEKLVDAEILTTELRAKLLGAKKASPTYVGYDGHYLSIGDTYYNSVAADEYEKLLATIAEGMGGRSMVGRGWQEHDADYKHAEPILEAKTREREADWERTAVLYFRHDSKPNAYAVFPLRSRAEAFLKVGRALRKMFDATHKAGKKAGADLLRDLRDEKITLKLFQEQVDKREKDDG